MSESVRERLVRGIAAARAGRPESIEEARYCLEWVTRQEDADADQKADAWLWLSRVLEDPGKKREYLTNVLAVDPGNSSARQDLAILDGRLKAADVIDPNQTVPPVNSPGTVPAAGVYRYVCASCGGRMSFNARQQAPVCNYCGARLSEEALQQRRETVTEQDFAATLPTAKAHRWELPAERTMKCSACGALMALPPSQVSGTCPFCGSAQIVAMQAGDTIEPTAVLPFRSEAGEAVRSSRSWMTRQRFRPGDLVEHADEPRLRAVYLPFWTFDLGGTMTWRALVARRRGRRTEWVPRDGVHLVYHDDLLVPASHSLPADLADKVADFKMDAIVPYSLDFLADCAVEIYQVPLDEASLLARQRALQAGREYEQKNSLAGEHYRDFIMNSLGMTVDSFKLVLLPFWIGGYSYRGNTFPLAVNGQTGTATGRVPRNALQKALGSLFNYQ